MRWSIVRVIWVRELRDQLRDRRTLFMIVLLPVLIYPLGGFAMMFFAAGFRSQPRTVGVCGAENLPPATSLVVREGDGGTFNPALFDNPYDADNLPLRFYPTQADGRASLDAGEVDAVVVIPPDLRDRLGDQSRPTVNVLTRPRDDQSRGTGLRVAGVLRRWDERLKRDRFDDLGLPPDFDHPIEVRDAERPPPSDHEALDSLYGLLIKVFPFVLMLWALVGALYPAVDLCAGEKERGTMETLLITPASREEIVWGKFLAIWVFSAGTSLVNLASMGVTTWQLGSHQGYNPMPPTAFLWCAVLLLPLAAFFSALCLAIGAYARSTKEGQYYLMPLFLVVLPLGLLTVLPGVKLDAFYSMVPITGVGLLLQQLLTSGAPEPSLWLYFGTVLGPMLLYSWLALRWAIDQFNREEVLFREAERLEIGLWLRRMLREKETRPSTGQALFCFALMLVWRWLTLGMGGSLLVTSMVTTLAFVAAPPLIMATTLTTQPRQSLALRLPPAWAWGMALALAVLLIPPLLESVHLGMRFSPDLRRLAEENEKLRRATDWLQRVGEESLAERLGVLLALAWLPAVCEEVAFRGFILTGLQRRYRPRTAVLLTSFLFAVLDMNVFRFVPMFVFGMVLAYLTTRCGSILPSIALHALYNSLLLTPALFPATAQVFALPDWALWAIAALTGIPGAALLWWLTRRHPHPEYVAILQSDPTLKPYDEVGARS